MSRLIGLTCAAFVAVGAAAAAAVVAAASDGSTRAPASVAKLVTHVPVKTLDTIGAGPIKTTAQIGSGFTVKKLNGPASGTAKPNVLAGELAWCPHCAVNGWALAIALSRFGTLSHLRVIDTGTYFAKVVKAKPAFSHTQGISFFHSGFKSSHLSFTNVVLQSVTGKPLQKPTNAEHAAIAVFDKPGLLPALDVGGAYGFVNSGFSPGVIHGLSAKKIAASLANAKSAVAQHIDGLANVFTAAMCTATHGLPTAVCASKGVTAAAKLLP
jgi:hypothetical protein